MKSTIVNAVVIRRVTAGQYSIKTIHNNTLTFARLTDAKNYVAANWSIALIEAQFEVAA